MKRQKLYITWLRHREAIIILFCAIFVLIMLCNIALWVVENFPYLSLFGCLLFLGGVLLINKK